MVVGVHDDSGGTVEEHDENDADAEYPERLPGFCERWKWYDSLRAALVERHVTRPDHKRSQRHVPEGVTRCQAGCKAVSRRVLQLVGNRIKVELALLRGEDTAAVDSTTPNGWDSSNLGDSDTRNQHHGGDHHGGLHHVGPDDCLNSSLESESVSFLIRRAFSSDFFLLTSIVYSTQQ